MIVCVIKFLEDSVNSNFRNFIILKVVRQSISSVCERINKNILEHVFLVTESLGTKLEGKKKRNDHEKKTDLNHRGYRSLPLEK